MNRFLGIVAAVILASVAIFNVGRESSQLINFGSVIILSAFGFILWVIIGRFTTGTERGSLPLTSALWLHSGLEGALTALSFNFGLGRGLLVLAAMLLHLLPESLAIIVILRRGGYSLKYAINTYVVSMTCLVFGFAVGSLVNLSEIVLTVLVTMVAGSFIYIATNSFEQSLQKS